MDVRMKGFSFLGEPFLFRDFTEYLLIAYEMSLRDIKPIPQSIHTFKQ